MWLTVILCWKSIKATAGDKAGRLYNRFTTGALLNFAGAFHCTLAIKWGEWQLLESKSIIITSFDSWIKIIFFRAKNEEEHLLQSLVQFSTQSVVAKEIFGCKPSVRRWAIIISLGVLMFIIQYIHPQIKHKSIELRLINIQNAAAPLQTVIGHFLLHARHPLINKSGPLITPNI